MLPRNDFPRHTTVKITHPEVFFSLYLLFKPHLHVAVWLRLRMKFSCERDEGRVRWQSGGRLQAVARTFLAPAVRGGNGGRGGIICLTLSTRGQKRSARYTASNVGLSWAQAACSARAPACYHVPETPHRWGKTKLQTKDEL